MSELSCLASTSGFFVISAIGTLLPVHACLIASAAKCKARTREVPSIRGQWTSGRDVSSGATVGRRSGSDVPRGGVVMSTRDKLRDAGVEGGTLRLLGQAGARPLEELVLDGKIAGTALSKLRDAFPVTGLWPCCLGSLRIS